MYLNFVTKKKFGHKKNKGKKKENSWSNAEL